MTLPTIKYKNGGELEALIRNWLEASSCGSSDFRPLTSAFLEESEWRAGRGWGIF